MTTRLLNPHNYAQDALASAAHARISWLLGDRTEPCPKCAAHVVFRDDAKKEGGYYLQRC